MPDNKIQSNASVSNYRQKKILELLLQKGTVSAAELSSEFGVSRITIRRDLDALAADSLLERTRGGAEAIYHPQLESLFDEKDHIAKWEKRVIGKYVASLIQEQATIFLNAGSTNLEVLRHLAPRPVKVVTNNAAALTLDLPPEIELIILGGEYRLQSRSLVGEIALNAIRHIFSSVTVLGINGISVETGLTSAVYQETTINRAMIENSSGKVIVVADHSKMNVVSSFLTCPLQKVDLLVTDWLSPPAFLNELREAGVKVVAVSEEAEE